MQNPKTFPGAERSGSELVSPVDLRDLKNSSDIPEFSKKFQP